MKEQKNNAWLQEVIGELDDELLLETEALRKNLYLNEYQHTQTKITIAKKDEIHADCKKKQYAIEQETMVQETLDEKEDAEKTGNKNNRVAGILKRNPFWKKTGVIVACVSIFFMAVFLWEINHSSGYETEKNEQINLEQEWIKENEIAKHEAEQNNSLNIQEGIEASGGMYEKMDSTTEEPENMQIGDLDTQNQNIQQSEAELSDVNTQSQNAQEGEAESNDSNYPERQQTSTSAPSVYIPKKEVSLTVSDEVASCMIGFFIYQGRVYVEYTVLEDAKELVGQKLATATGLIDEWTKQDGYVELAGSVNGDFYEVNGYEPEFMLCMQMQDGRVWLFVNDNDLLLEKGADIFETYLHLSETSYEAFYMTNAVWNNGKAYEEKKVPVSTAEEKKVERLLENMKAGTVVLTKDVWKDYGIGVFYNEKQLYHLYLELEDGMRIHLRIFEGGYVMFEGIKDVCIKI